MGNKKKRQPKPKPVEDKPNLNPEDDPYWQVSPESYDPKRGSDYLERFRRFSFEHPQWVHDIVHGMPTYYGVLNVLKGASAEELRLAYEREKEFSALPDETVEEAYSVLSDLQNRVKYGEFLILFEKVSIFFPPEEKEELVSVHAKVLEMTRNARRIQTVNQEYHDYLMLVGVGMPDIFEFSGLGPDCTEEEAAGYATEGNELSMKISSILKDPLQREKFVFVREFFENIEDPEREANIVGMREIWSTYGEEYIQKILLMSLSTSKQFSTIMARIHNIFSQNHDWINYLPPGDKTFFSIFDLDESVCSLSKGEFESVLRARYRTLDRTPEVNLAYTVLKNQNLREEYIWLMKHYDLKKLDPVLDYKSSDDEEEEDDEEALYRAFIEDMMRLKRRFGSPSGRPPKFR